MIAITGFDHLSLTCRRAKATQTFYENVLGFRVTSRLPQYGMTQMKAGKAEIVIVDAAAKEGAWANSPRGKGENVHHYCLRLQSFDEASLRALLKQNAIAIEEEAHEHTPAGPEKAFYIRDPEGNCIELRGLSGKKKPPRRKARRRG